MEDKANSHAAVRLIEQARMAAKAAYAPYSNFCVGCAIELKDGSVVLGANMENACYRLGVCAEIAALTAANQVQGLTAIQRIAIVGGRLASDGTLGGVTTVTPCGGCRQAILEAAQLSKRDFEIICADGDGNNAKSFTIGELIPYSFGPANLAGRE
jgi:cytidine deaminase